MTSGLPQRPRPGCTFRHAMDEWLDPEFNPWSPTDNAKAALTLARREGNAAQSVKAQRTEDRTPSRAGEED